MENYQLDIDGKKPTSESINSRKDFQAFHKNYIKVTKPFYKKGWFWGSAGLATLIGFGLFVGMEMGAASTMTETEMLANTATPKESSTEAPFINPPLPNADVPFSTTAVNNEEGLEFTSSHGSTYSIPDHAFVYENGQPVEGKVEIKTREFHNHADIFLSGIPMTYDSAGSTYQFESAGMLEIRAFKDGEAVQLAPGKTIDIEMVSSSNDSKYNLYKLNEKERNWDCLGKSEIKAETEAIETSTETVLSKADSAEIKKQAEVLMQKAPEYEKASKKRMQISREVANIKAAQPAAPTKATKEATKFNLDFPRDEFPELTAYDGVLFQLDEGEIINPNDAQVTWNDVQIEKQKEKYKVVFAQKETGRSVSYLAIPVYEGKSYEAAKKQFDAEFENYQTKLQERLNDEKMALSKLDQIKAKYFGKAQEKYQVNLGSISSQNYETKVVMKKITRFFRANSLGIYNSDHPAPVAANADFLASSLEVKHKRAAQIQAFHMNSDIQTVFNIDIVANQKVGYRGKTGKNAIIAVQENEYAIMDTETFANLIITPGSAIVFNDFIKADNYNIVREQLNALLR